MLLEIEDLHVAYGKAEVVHGISFGVAASEFFTLLGRNGAGKTTTLHAISGLIPKRSGRVVFDGRDITAKSPAEIAQAGLIQVLEGHRVFHPLTVEDNLLIGTYPRSPRGDRSKLDGMYDLFPELAERRKQPASRLSGGQQQILAVAQGLIADPQLLILDEPSGGLAPLLINRILDIARDYADKGMTILLVEQLVEKALARADRCALIAGGKIARVDQASSIIGSPALHEIFLGSA